MACPLFFPPFIMFAGKKLMNGERRGTTTGAAEHRPGPDFGPSWPEVSNYFAVGWLKQAVMKA